MTFDQIHDIAQGRVWTGNDGLKIGLIDTLGGLYTAIEIAKNLAGINENTDPKIVVYPRKKSLLSKLIKNLTFMKNSKDYLIINKARKFIKEFELKPLALMPFEIDLK